MFKSDTLKITFTYVGALVGAGFATGQEIMQFFTVFDKGVPGAIFSTLCIAVFGVLYLHITYNEDIHTYYDFLNVIADRKVAKAFDIAISLFLFGGFTIMIAAGYGLLKENIISVGYANYAIIALVLYLSFSRGIKGILKLNTILIPLLITVILILCVSSLSLSSQTFGDGFVPSNYMFSGVTYASYNLIIGMVVLSSLKNEIYNKSAIIFGPLYAGGLLGMMLILMVLATKGLNTTSEIPILDLARPLGKGFYYMLLPSIGIAILTSAIASGHGLVVRVQQITKLSYDKLVLLMIAIAIPMSSFGFTQLIKFVYPFFGFVNFVIMLLTVKYFFTKFVSYIRVK